ncbi:MAG TPA: hypothetical protein VM165_14000 [Planctomycetaceae bacterium]|nr:hypothetical protein [Planctomycetaceae bacterium]
MTIHRRLWSLGFGLCTVGTLLVTVAAGQAVFAASQPQPAGHWQALAAEGLGGALLVTTGFAAMVSSTTDVVGKGSQTVQTTTANTVPCGICGTSCDVTARFCSQCGNFLRG